jgi:hypothetical protein
MASGSGVWTTRLLHCLTRSKGAAEVVDFDLEYADFDLDRLPWLKDIVEHYEKDQTQGLFLSGPAKCGKTQFLQTLCMNLSRKRARDQETEALTAGFLISNDRDNFSRCTRAKKNRPQILDDPVLTGWKQADWLAWFDLVAVGVTARTRYENTPMSDFRCMATNKDKGEIFLDSHGQSLAAEEIGAVRNKAVFVDLYDKEKLQQMRLSTWYRDNVDGKPVRIMLTVEGERKVRERYGLPCPDTPTAVDAEGAPGSPPDMQSDGASERVHMNLSPRTVAKLHSAFSASSASSSSGGVSLPAETVAKLRVALQRPCSNLADSLRT